MPGTPRVKKDRAKMLADSTRAGQIRAAHRTSADDYNSRLHALRTTPEYKKWISGWQAQQSSMDTVAFRALDRSRGRSSGG